MTHSSSPTHRKWLWLLLGVWLIVIQSVALSHSAEHSLEHEHAHCFLCDFGHEQNAGPSSVLMPPMGLQQAESIPQKPYQQPSLPWVRHFNVRAPPLLF
ncbi:hypothetical protein Sbal175_3478 [Shewanella baltica BA175]|uniref:hypothetical protein n=1 Tax=Shewanella baltica TaxID=62322 RepID=UPI0001E4B3B3|nr:hypothetical protein [Shewanella baltica]AEG12711.1 hypothetical protein Sbal175_3478 [Shewanella baltica BA175]